MSQRRELHYSGRVQGVGFRYTVQSLAGPFAVTGFVKNLPDGRVQLVVEGEPAEISRFLHEIQVALGRYVRGIQETNSAATGSFSGFDIRY